MSAYSLFLEQLSKDEGRLLELLKNKKNGVVRSREEAKHLNDEISALKEKIKQSYSELKGIRAECIEVLLKSNELLEKRQDQLIFQLHRAVLDHVFKNDKALYREYLD